MAEITARAITPVAVEMLDGVMLRMVEEATHAGYPMDAAGGAAGGTRGHERSRGGAGGADPRSLHGHAARASFAWRARRRSAICFGRAARMPSARWAESARRIMCRTAWCRGLRSHRRWAIIGDVAEKYGLTISNIFHAGDGNMHPIILFDPRKEGDMEKARHAGEEILDVLHLHGRIDYRRAWCRHGEERVDGRIILGGFARHDSQLQRSIRSRPDD